MPGVKIGRVRFQRVDLADEAEVADWIGAPQVEFGGLEPETLALDGEEGLQLVLWELVRLGRQREAAGG